MRNAIKRFTLLLLTLFIPFSIAYGTVYTAVTSGDWSAAATWGGTAPGNLITNGDQVIIPVGIDVNLDNDVAVNAPSSFIEVNGTLNTNAGKSVGVNMGSLTGTGTIDVKEIGIATGGALVFTGMLNVERLAMDGTNFVLAAQGTVTDRLELSNGDLSIQTGALLEIANDASIRLENASLLNTGGTINGLGTVNLQYSGASTSTGLETSLGSTGDVAIDLDNPTDQLNLSNDLTVNGMLQIDNGQLMVGNNDLNIYGDAMLASNGDINTTEKSNLTIQTAGSLSSDISFSGGSDTLNNLTIDIGAGNEAGFDSDVHIQGSLDLSSGTMSALNQSVAAYGTVNSGANAKIASNMNSNLWLKTNGGVSGDLQFEDTANALNDFEIDLGSSSNVSLNSELEINGTLNFENGSLVINNDNLVLTSNANISGANSYNYIMTEGTGFVQMNVTMADGMVEFPIGNTTNGFAAAGLTLNNTSSNGNFMVRVMNDVYAQGTSGTDLSASEAVVDNTWMIDTDVAGSVDVDVNLTWKYDAEVNGFDNSKAFISNFDAGSWDTIPASAANYNPDTTYTIARNGLSNLGPFAVFEGTASGNVYTAVASGDWSAAATWGGTSPGPVVDGTEQVVIPLGMDVNLDIDVEVNSSTSSVEVLGSLSSNTDKMMTNTNGTILGTGTIDIGSLMLVAGSALAFTGNLNLNNLYVDGHSLALGLMGRVNDTLSISNGALTVQSGSGLVLENGATVMTKNGNLGNTGISIASGGSVNLYYSGSTDTASGELNIGSINDVTVNLDNANDELGLTSNLIVEGNLNVTNGTLNLNGNGMSLRSDLMMTANGYLSAENSAISLKTNGSLSSAIKFKDGSDTLRGLTIEVGSGNEAEFDSDVTVDGKFNLRSGTMNITGQSLTLSDQITAEADGELATDNQTNLSIAASGNVSGAINFNASSNMLGNFEVNLAGSDSVAIGSDVIVDGRLMLTNGNIAIGNNDLMVTANADVQGGSLNSYIQTSGSGSLGINISAGNSEDFYVGTADKYGMASLTVNTGSSDGNFMVRVMNDVYADGTSGVDITDTADAVDQTWDITTDAAGSVDVDLALTWEGTAEVNGFNSAEAYISHYTGGNWDANATASATANGNGTFTLSRNNVTGLSPFAVFSEGQAQATTYTAIVDGDWSAGSTWDVGTSPGATVDNGDEVIVPLGLDVNLDEDVTINDASSSLEVGGQLIAGTENDLTVVSGSILGVGTIDVDQFEIQSGGSMVTTGNLVANTYIADGGSFSLSLGNEIKDTLWIRHGSISLQAGALFDFESGATIILEDGSFTNVAGSVNSAGQTNIVYNGSSASTGDEVSVSSVGNLWVDLNSSSDELMLSSDLAVDGTLNVNSGMLTIGDNSLTLNGDYMASANGSLNASDQSNLMITSSSSISTAISFEGGSDTLNNLVIDFDNSTDTVGFNSEVHINGMLQLDTGRAVIANTNLMLTANATTQGGGPESYVQTNGSGYLSINLSSGNSSDYHVGTAEGYAGANIELNSGSGDGSYMVRAMNDVWAQGTAGADISATQPVVDHTWDITTDASAGVDVDLALTWEGSAEANSFDNMNAYISHYVNGSWDATATASATANANGTFTLTRDNVTSLSPFAVFDENTSVGIEDETVAQQYLNMYPNPVAKTLFIESELNEPTLIQIYSIDGRLIKQTEINHGHNAISLTGIEEGTYYLHLAGEESGLKFIKQ